MAYVFCIWLLGLMYSWAVATRRYSSLIHCVALRHSNKSASGDHIPCYGITQSPCRCRLPKLVLSWSTTEE